MGWIGCVCCEIFWHDFVVRTWELIAKVWPALHQSSCSNETVRNAPKHEFGVQWGGSGAFVAKNSDATSLYERVHSLDKFVLFCTNFHVVRKWSETPQNMSLGSNRVDRVRLLWKIPTRLRGTNLCINGTSSTRFALKFMQKQTVWDTPKYEFGVQWDRSGAFVAKKFRRDFVARTCALTAPSQPILHWCLCSNVQS
jgi:hypothetical protein